MEVAQIWYVRRIYHFETFYISYVIYEFDNLYIQIFLKVCKDRDYKSPLIIPFLFKNIYHWKWFSNANLNSSAEIQTDLSFFPL